MKRVMFDPGHYARYNAGPPGYYEGDAMLEFGLALQREYGVLLTRQDGKNLDLKERADKAADAGCDTLISLHTNAPEAAKGVIIFYSVQRPGDRVIAEALGQALAKAMGLTFRGAKVRTFEKDPTTDYYGVIRHSIRHGLEHAFIVEHGSHWEFAANMQAKIAACVMVYGEFLGKVKDMDWLDVIKKVTDSPEKWEKAIITAVNAAKADGDLGPLEIFKFLPDLVLKIYRNRGVYGAGLTWEEIITKITDSPTAWLTGISVVVNAARAEGDLGPLEIFKYLPELIMKVYNSPR